MPRFQQWSLKVHFIHCSLLHIRVTVFGPFTSCCTSSTHSSLSCVLLTIKSVEGSLPELSTRCLDSLDLLHSPWTSPLLLFDPLLPRRIAWSVFSCWDILVISILLLFSPFTFPSLDLPLLVFAFFDLPSLLSDDFPCCCEICWGGVIGGCGSLVEGSILVATAAWLVCTILLSTTTSVRWSSSVCSLAKLTNTYKNELVLVSH